MSQKQAPRTLPEQLAAVLAYRNRPEETVEPLQSNWTVVAANDNADPEETIDYRFERHLLVTPSVQEIMRQVKDGEVVHGDVPAPVKGKPDPKRAPIVAIGRLKFSDGTQTEKAYLTGPDGDTVKYDRTMPPGAMLHTREKGATPVGGKGFTDVDLGNSNAFFASTFDTELPRFIKRGERRNGPSLTAQQSKQMLAEAIANTKVMPPVTICPRALPCGAERVSDSFVGFAKVPTGQSGSVAWQDIGQTIENAKVWKQVLKALKEKDVAALDAAMAAQSYEDVGVAVGQTPTYADKKGGGRRSLLAANDNLAAAIKKYVA